MLCCAVTILQERSNPGQVTTSVMTVASVPIEPDQQLQMAPADPPFSESETEMEVIKSRTPHDLARILKQQHHTHPDP